MPTLIFPSKFTSGNPSKEKELHCLAPELYSLVFWLEGRFYIIAGRESLVSSHLREWECHAHKYIRLLFCRRIQFLYLLCKGSRPCFAQGWRNNPPRQARTVLTERCCLWPSQWRTDEALLLTKRLVGPLKKNRMGAWVSLSNILDSLLNIQQLLQMTCCYNLEVSFLEWCCWRSEQT